MIGREPQRKTKSAGGTFLVVVLALFLTALADSQSLVRGAERLPYGSHRDFWLHIWHPVQSAASLVYLDRPRRWIDEAAGRSDTAPAGKTAELAAVDGPSANEAEPGGPAALPADIFAPMPEPAPLPPPPPPPVFRHATAEAPLRVWVGGDSLAVFFAQSLLQQAARTGLIIGDTTTRISSGLARPDFYDWPAELLAVTSGEQPDVVIMLIGTNDAQSIRTAAGPTVTPGTDAWRAEYRARVVQVMETVGAPGRLVVWVGLPPMRSASLNSRAADMNAIFAEVVHDHAGARYVDAWQMFAGDDGGYTAYIRPADANLVQVREQDGVHFTRAGADYLATDVLNVISDTFGFGASAASR